MLFFGVELGCILGPKTRWLDKIARHLRRDGANHACLEIGRLTNGSITTCSRHHVTTGYLSRGEIQRNNFGVHPPAIFSPPLRGAEPLRQKAKTRKSRRFGRNNERRDRSIVKIEKYPQRYPRGAGALARPARRRRQRAPARAQRAHPSCVVSRISLGLTSTL